jgi:hypothetical protein
MGYCADVPMLLPLLPSMVSQHLLQISQRITARLSLTPFDTSWTQAAFITPCPIGVLAIAGEPSCGLATEFSIRKVSIEIRLVYRTATTWYSLAAA